MRKVIYSVSLSFLLSVSTFAYRPQQAKLATIEPETKAQVILQTRLSSKLSEPGDPITAILAEPVTVNGQLVLARGTEFHGKVVSTKPAGHAQKSAQMVIAFDHVAMPWGEEPVSVILTAVDDWARDEKLKANDEGGVKGGKDGKKTVDNVVKGGEIGALGGTGVILGGAAAGATGPATLGIGAGAIGAGLLGGLLLSKGNEVRLAPGTTFRIKFVKPISLPVLDQPTLGPRPIQQDDGVAKEGPPTDPTKKP